MSTLLEKPIRVSRIVTTNIVQARALEDPARAKIVQMLYNKSLSAVQICQHLEKSGFAKALTTIRHHLDILKEAGLVEIAKIEETRGAITKYYSTSTKLLGYNVPEDFDTKYSSAIKDASKLLEDVLHSIATKATPKLKNQQDPAFSQYIQLEIINRAMTRILEDNIEKPTSGKNSKKTPKSNSLTAKK